MFEASVIEPSVSFLKRLAGTAPALEFAIGTGRLALPLHAAGVEVRGIELSTAMVSQLRAKPGGDEATIPVTVGDMASAEAPGAGSFGLVYLVFNSITNLTSQDEQVACFANAERHLAPGGSFVVETFVPRLRHLQPGERFVPFEVGSTFVGIDEYDVVDQRLTSHYVQTRGDAVERSAMPFRYVWPAELDLMARLAGLTLAARWADWNRGAFTHDSDAHVSVWRKPG
jgi:SAM-dependent methyltransferase